MAIPYRTAKFKSANIFCNGDFGLNRFNQIRVCSDVRPRNPGQSAESAKTIHFLWCAIIKCAFRENRDQPPWGPTAKFNSRQYLELYGYRAFSRGGASWGQKVKISNAQGLKNPAPQLCLACVVCSNYNKKAEPNRKFYLTTEKLQYHWLIESQGNSLVCCPQVDESAYVIKEFPLIITDLRKSNNS